MKGVARGATLYTKVGDQVLTVLVLDKGPDRATWWVKPQNAIPVPSTALYETAALAAAGRA